MIKFFVDKYYKYQSIINYIIVGGFTTVVSIVSYFILTKLFLIPYMISTILSWIMAVLFAYFTNKKYVFKSKNKNILELINFIKYRLLSLLIEMVIMYILVSILKIDDGIAKIGTQVVVLVLNYLFSKLFVFKKI